MINRIRRERDLRSVDNVSQSLQRFVVRRSQTEGVPHCKVHKPVVVVVPVILSLESDVLGSHPSALDLAQIPDQVNIVLGSPEDGDIRFAGMADDRDRDHEVLHGFKVDNLVWIMTFPLLLLVDNVLLQDEWEVAEITFLQIREDISKAVFERDLSSGLCRDHLISGIHKEEVPDQDRSECDRHLKGQDPSAVAVFLKLGIKADIQSQGL